MLRRRTRWVSKKSSLFRRESSAEHPIQTGARFLVRTGRGRFPAFSNNDQEVLFISRVAFVKVQADAVTHYLRIPVVDENDFLAGTLIAENLFHDEENDESGRFVRDIMNPDFLHLLP